MATIVAIARTLRLRSIGYLSGIAMTSGGSVYVVMSAVSDLWLVPLIILGFWSAVQALSRSERVVRDVQYFLEALRQNDYSVRLAGSLDSRLYTAMGAAMERVLDDFRVHRSRQHERIRFLDNAVEHVGTALLAYDSGGNITLLNVAARRMLNVHRVRRMATVAERAPALVEALNRFERGGQTLTTIPDSEGQSRHVLLYATRMTVGGITHVLAAMYDIGEELEERDLQAWQQLTRVLTHEIMNSVAPIASLAGTVERLIRDDSRQHGGDDVAEAVSVIRRRSEALINFVDAYRSFSRIPAPEYQISEVDGLLHGVERLMRAEAERSGVIIERAVEPEGLRLAADPNLVEQVLINLVLNAIQATTGVGGGRVVLRARADRRGIAVIEVEDDGPGIEPDVQEHIFVPFFTTKPDGSGIGLSLSRQIMRLHGGTISVRSVRGQTVFSLRF